MRRVLALGAGAVTAALGALILGEYDLSGLTIPVAGALFGLAVAEVVLWVGRRRARLESVAAALLAAAGLVWAGWITVRNRRGEPIPGGAWMAAAIAAAVALVRARPRSAGR